MKKIILALVATAFSLTSMANVVTCIGQTTRASIELGLTGQAFPLYKADYSFADKLVKTSGHEFGIQVDKESQAQKLTYKFRTLKRHKLAKKGSELTLTIRQTAIDADPFEFILNETHDAELTIRTNGELQMIEKMDCTSA